MAVSVPKLCMEAVAKACRSREARITAIALLPIGGRDSTSVAAIVDQPTFATCGVCQYVASSGREMIMHMVTAHGAIIDIQECVDVMYCARRHVDDHELAHTTHFHLRTMPPEWLCQSWFTSM